MTTTIKELTASIKYKVEFEEVRYGMLMMVLCDREGRVYDVWITFGSVHEVRAFRERKKRSLWFRGLVENCGGFYRWQTLWMYIKNLKRMYYSIQSLKR